MTTEFRKLDWPEVRAALKGKIGAVTVADLLTEEAQDTLCANLLAACDSESGVAHGIACALATGLAIGSLSRVGDYLLEVSQRPEGQKGTER